MLRINRFPSRAVTLPRFELGDRVLIQPWNKEGVITGVRYGEIAYDVLCGREYLRNLSPKLMRLFPPQFSVVA